MTSLSVYAQDSWEAKRIAQEATGRGLRVQEYDYRQVWDERVPEIGVFRTLVDRILGYDNREMAREMAGKIENNQGYVFNRSAVFDELLNKREQSQRMSEHSLPVVNEYKLIEDVSYPMIVKLKNGSLGIGVKIINTASELKQFWLENNREDWLMQELMEVGRDLRVLVLGGSVMGGMERRAVEGKVVANYSQGGTVNQVELTESQKKLALRAAEVLKLEYAGVDLIRDQERQWRILEVNRCAQFRGFEKATQQNVALEIVDYCIGRLEDTATKVRD